MKCRELLKLSVHLAGLKRRAVFACVTFLMAPTAFSVTPSMQPAPAALSLQAKLFYKNTGTFSADVLTPEGPALGNVIAGENASTSSFVVVVVALADGAVIPSDSKMRLVARESGTKNSRSTLLLDKTLPLGSVRKSGTTHIGFWLPNTGCKAINLQATLTVARQPVVIKADATIPFVCNE